MRNMDELLRLQEQARGAARLNELGRRFASLGKNATDTVVARWVRVRKNSGSAGGPNEQCTWTYDLYNPTGDIDPASPIIANVSNVFGRAVAGRYVPARDYTYAIAVPPTLDDPSDPDNWLLLAVIDEVPEVAVCNSAPVGG